MTTFTIEADCLKLCGELNLTQVAFIWQALQNRPELKGVNVIDCHDITHLDSGGVALLCELQYLLKRRVRLKGGAFNLLTLITLYNLDSVFVIDEESL